MLSNVECKKLMSKLMRGKNVKIVKGGGGEKEKLVAQRLASESLNVAYPSSSLTDHKVLLLTRGKNV